MNDTKVAAFREENVLLRSRVDALEWLTNSMKREISTLKVALGPWYSSDASANGSSSSGQSTLVPSQYIPNTGVLEQMPLEVDTSMPYDSLGRLLIDEASSPPLFSPTGMPRMHHRASSSINVHRGQDTVHPSHPPQNPIAPLNLSTTLEGSMEGLRTSLVSLASSVDSLGRRNDIALTNETMRLNEDVMSMRAAIHGLRLQVICW